MTKRYVFDQVGDEKHKNDSVIGCIRNGNECACIDCGAKCQYEGAARWEVA